jgi:putative aldouronate transport system permease protein
MKSFISWFKTNEIWLDLIIYPFIIFVFVVMLYPFLNVLAIALNDSMDTIRGGIHIWPRQFTLQNMKQMFEHPNLDIATFNSVARTVIGTAMNVLFISLTAYVLSRRDFIIRKPLTLLFTISMYVSGGLIPFYLLIRSLGLMNSFNVYIIPGLISVYLVILMRTYMDTIPESLQESARIDGASDFYIYRRIIMPLCLPSIATVVLFTSVGHWNSWFDAYLYNSRNTNLTVLQFELQKLLQNTMRANEEMLGVDMIRVMETVTPRSMRMAITVLVTLPIVFVYPFIQRYLIKGMMIGSIKG